MNAPLEPRDALEAAHAALVGNPQAQQIIGFMIRQQVDRNGALHWLVATLGLISSLIERLRELLHSITITGGQIPKDIAYERDEFDKVFKNRIKFLVDRMHYLSKQLDEHVKYIKELEGRLKGVSSFAAEEMARQAPSIANKICEKSIDQFKHHIKRAVREERNSWLENVRRNNEFSVKHLIASGIAGFIVCATCAVFYYFSS